jgi:hypothetical protein
LSFFDEVVGAWDGAHYTAAWNMREKSMMGVTIELPDEVVIDPGGADDRVGMHILGVNSFDGSTGLTGALIATRWFCLNQLVPSLKNATNKFSLRHTTNIKSRTAEAAKMIGVHRDYMAALDAVGNKLHALTMTDAQFERFLAKCDDFRLDGTESGLVTGRVKARREEALATWRAPHNENITGTRWGALNVVAEYAEWGRTVKGSPRTGTTPERQRAIGTLVNNGVTMQVPKAAALLGV